MILVRPFFVPRRLPANLLAAVDQPLNTIALSVQPTIKWPRAPFIRSARARHADAVPPPRLRWSDAGQSVTLYDDDRGVSLGTLDAGAFRRLRRALPDYDSRAGTATFGLPEVERLRELTGDAALADVLAQRIGRSGALRVRAAT